MNEFGVGVTKSLSQGTELTIICCSGNRGFHIFGL